MRIACIISNDSVFFSEVDLFTCVWYCSSLQAEDCDEEWHIPVARYEDNTMVIEAYSDPQLQPVVVMKRLDKSWYSADMLILVFYQIL